MLLLGGTGGPAPPRDEHPQWAAPREVCAAAESLSAEVQPSRPHFLSCSLLEESYVMRDPFTPDKGRFLIVGSRCSMCSKLVCVGPVGKPRAPGDAFPLSPVAGTSQAWSRER